MEKKTVIIEVQTEEGVKNLDRMSAKFDEVYGDILPLTGAIGELEDQLYEMAKRGEQGTDEFKALAAEAGRLKKTIQQVDMEVDALSMTTANKLGGALGGVASGFELAQGAMAAMGADSAKVEEALLKVQSAMAMAQGIQGLKESLPALKAVGQVAVKALSTVRGAVMATGIGLLAVAVGLVAANFDKIKGSAEKASKSFTDYLNSGTKGAKALKWYLDALIYPITLAIKAYREIKDAIMGTSDASRKAAVEAQKVHKQRMAAFDAERKAQQQALTDLDYKIQLLDAEGKSTVELRKKKIELQKADAESTLQALEATKAMLGKNSVMGKSYDDLINSAKGTLNRIAIEEKKLEKEVKDSEKEKANARKEAAENRKAEEEKEAEDKKQREKEAADKQIEEQKRAYDEMVRLNEERIKKEDAQYQLQQSLTQTDFDKEISDLVSQYDAKFEIANGNAELEKQLEEQLQTDIAAIQKKYADKKEEDDKIRAAKEKQLRKDVESAKIQLATNGLQLISDIADLFADGDEKRARTAFKIKKAASIAQTTISTIEGTQAAFQTAAASPITTLFPAYPFLQAASAAAFGAVKIAGIAKTQFGGGGSSSGAASVGGGSPSITQSTPAQFNIVGNSNTNQLVEGLGGTAVKAYVVSGEMSSAQSLERNKIKTATI